MERLSQWLTTVASRDELAQVVGPIAEMLHADQVVLSRLDALSGRRTPSRLVAGRPPATATTWPTTR